MGSQGRGTGALGAGWRPGAVAGRLSVGVLAAGALCAGLAGCGSPATPGQTAATVSAGSAASAGQAAAPAGAAHTIALGAADSGRHLRLVRGDEVVVTLPSNPSTGYAWEVARVSGHALRADGKASYQQGTEATPTAAATPMPGAGGTMTFKFTAAEAGPARIELVYRRSWEKDVRPAKTFTVCARVHATSL